MDFPFCTWQMEVDSLNGHGTWKYLREAKIGTVYEFFKRKLLFLVQSIHWRMQKTFWYIIILIV